MCERESKRGRVSERDETEREERGERGAVSWREKALLSARRRHT